METTETIVILTKKKKNALRARCAGRSLRDLRPDLAAQWHPTLNGDLTPDMVTLGCNTKVSWLLEYYDPKTDKTFPFVWPARVAQRVGGTGCPFLKGAAVWPGYNDLATNCPQMAAWWHPTLNEDLTPEMVTVSAHTKVWWLLPYDDPKTGKHFDFVWDNPVSTQTRTQSCPYFSGQRVWPGFNDLATTHPEIAAEWHPTLNGDLTPEMFTAGANKEVWWLIDYYDASRQQTFSLSWPAKIPNRTMKGAGCPFLTGNAVLPGFNDLKTLYPDIAAQIHPTLNKDVDPSKILPGSNKYLHWMCEKGHVWYTQIATRVKKERGCSACRQSHGERRTLNFLKSHDIPFASQYGFKDCRDQKCLPFDFAVLNEDRTVRLLIEYDGEQHEKPIRFSNKTSAEEEFVLRQLHDNIKTQYCRERRIPLVRISYKDYDNIEQILLRKAVRYGVLN